MALVLLASTGTGRLAAAGDDGPRLPEYLIKAAYLYNFALFVEWPADAFTAPDAPFVVGIVGSDPFGWAIDRTVRDKRINSRRIVVERLQSSQDVRHCHMLFVSGSDGALSADLAKRLDRLPILIVGDAPTPSTPGGAVAFTVHDNKVGFEIDLQATKRTRLKISSKMLSLARVVRGS
jgi:hypothetical protein